MPRTRASATVLVLLALLAPPAVAQSGVPPSTRIVDATILGADGFADFLGGESPHVEVRQKIVLRIGLERDRGASL